jgi:hypothetical protein
MPVDTAPEIEAFMLERFRALSGSERGLMALQMFESAQRVVLSSLPEGLSEHQRRRELLRRFYGDELANKVFP